jgi:hypothetical protein
MTGENILVVVSLVLAIASLVAAILVAASIDQKGPYDKYK